MKRHTCMSYSAASLANAFLDRSARDDIGISPMKAQKLLYFVHGYGLVECREPLLNEVFEAWKFGPVLASVYHECKKYRSGHITHHLMDVDEMGFRSKAPVPNDHMVNDLIDFVWAEYGPMNALDLSDWTHVKGGPWDTVTRGGTRILRHQDVPNDLIRDYFVRNMYNNNDTEEAPAAASG